MNFQRKCLYVAMAASMPIFSANAQSSADLKQELETMRAQMQLMQQKIDALSAKVENPAREERFNMVEQKVELAQDERETAGIRGLKISGVIEAAYIQNDLGNDHVFSGSAGYGAGESAMIQITKESQEGKGVDWTLRLLPGAPGASTGVPGYFVNEASISIPLDDHNGNRILAGLMPAFEGYEFSFANANPTLGNQLITHNLLFDLAGTSAYTGIGMAHTFDNGNYALKWVVANIDPAYDTTANNATNVLGNVNDTADSSAKSVGFAVRGDWYIDAYTYVSATFSNAGGNRNFSLAEAEAGYTHGNWQLNGQVMSGVLRNAAANGLDAQWTGVSTLVGYKIVPRLQLLARLDYLDNHANGGGTYGYYGAGSGNTAVGLGPERDSTGAIISLDASGLPDTGANLTRLSLGTNYQINTNAQWKTEYRLDQSSGYNFSADGINFTRSKNTFATSVVLSF